MKRETEFELHQTSRVKSIQVEEKEGKKIEGLDDVKRMRTVTLMEFSLSKKEPEAKELGYQAPVTAEEKEEHKKYREEHEKQVKENKANRKKQKKDSKPASRAQKGKQGGKGKGKKGFNDFEEDETNQKPKQAQRKPREQAPKPSQDSTRGRGVRGRGRGLPRHPRIYNDDIVGEMPSRSRGAGRGAGRGLGRGAGPPQMPMGQRGQPSRGRGVGPREHYQQEPRRPGRGGVARVLQQPQLGANPYMNQRGGPRGRAPMGPHMGMSMY